jgi:DNA topoisomerase-3
MKRHICAKEVPREEFLRMLETGRSELIQGFMSKRGSAFGAYLVLSPTGVKADFEFPPR